MRHLQARLPGLARAAATFALALGCAGAPRAAIPPTSRGAADACADLNPLLDLRADLLEPVPAGGEAGQLALLDNQLAAVALAEQRLRRAGTSLGDLPAELRALATTLAAQRKIVDHAARKLEASYGAVDAALDEAASCQGIDLRVLEAPAKASRMERAAAAFAATSAEAKAQRARNKTLTDRSACAPRRRLLSALGSLDVTSKASTAAVGEHLAEMSIDGQALAAKNELSRALIEHSANLRAFAEAADPHDPHGARAQLALLVERLERRGRACLESMTEPSSQIVEGDRAPRQVTVLVKPKWPARYAGAATDTGIFGSGILVRWRTPTGATETRVVTNAHVLDGADEAEVFDAEGAAAQVAAESPRKAHERAWNAKLVRMSSDDDLAVLRLDSAPAAALHGLGLRLSPPREDEAVVAAGFPGIGARPSFQLSRGTVSNASFRTGTGAFGAYLQHTAAIDPGNSGGPLLDSDGRLLGINTIKIMGRESVGFAIPAVRVQVALLRAGDRRQFLPGNAASLCGAFAGAMSATAPHGAIVERISLGLHDPEVRSVGARTVAYRDAVAPRGEGPLWDARLGAYARLRVRLEDEGGVAPLTACSDVHAVGGSSFEATFRTRGGSHRLRMDDEAGTLRITAIQPASQLGNTPIR